MKIAIQTKAKSIIYMDKTALNKCTEEELRQPPYNYSFVKVDEQYSDCEASDFNDDLTFSETKYNARKLLESNQSRIAELKQRLSQLSEDIIQSTAGEIIYDIGSRKAEFVKLHNELRVLLGKSERKVEKVI